MKTPITDTACAVWCPKAAEAMIPQVVPAIVARDMEVVLNAAEEYIRGFIFIPGSRAESKRDDILLKFDVLRRLASRDELRARFDQEIHTPRFYG